MKIYTFYTDTHKVLFDRFFLPSFQKHGLDKNFELIVLNGDQFSPSGEFNSEGTLDTWDERLSMFDKIVDENWGNHFVYSDCDMQFFSNFTDDLMSYANDNIDIWAQSDMGTICTGFMLVKANKITKRYFAKIKTDLRKFANDQICANHYKNFVRFSLLPENKYMTIASLNGGNVWTPESADIDIPESVIVHHGNYTIGIENKVKLMEYVRSKRRKQ